MEFEIQNYEIVGDGLVQFFPKPIIEPERISLEGNLNCFIGIGQSSKIEELYEEIDHLESELSTIEDGFEDDIDNLNDQIEILEHKVNKIEEYESVLEELKEAIENGEDKESLLKRFDDVI